MDVIMKWSLHRGLNQPLSYFHLYFDENRVLQSPSRGSLVRIGSHEYSVETSLILCLDIINGNREAWFIDTTGRR